MTNIQTKNRQVNHLLTLILFGVFALCVLSVLLTGGGAYKRLTERDQNAYLQRTCIQYLSTKVRQGDTPSITSFGGNDALLLPQVIGEETYVTRIYCYDGWLRELFSDPEGAFLPEDGEKILEAEHLALTLENGLLTLSVTHTRGEETTLLLALRGERGAIV